MIGINQYPNLAANLQTAVKDAEEIAKRLKYLQNFDQVLLMTDVSKAQLTTLLQWLEQPSHASTPAIPNRDFSAGLGTYTSRVGWLKLESELAPHKDKNTLEELILKIDEGTPSEQWKKMYLVAAEAHSVDPLGEPYIGPEDSVVFYYAGHGFPGEVGAGPAGYLAPTDASNKLVDNTSLLPMDTVYRALSNGVACKHTLLILDCCFAGKFRFSNLHRGRPRPFLLPIHERRFNHFRSKHAWQVLTSAGPEETAADSAAWANIRDHSPFAQTLIDALEGKADFPASGNRGKNQGDGIVTATEIFLYVWDKVEQISSESKGQHPGLFPMEQHREGEFIFLNPRIDPARFQFADDPDQNPYRGLRPYELADANLFFGREEATQKLKDHLLDTGIVFVTGPSGSGKSSLVRAGVFPLLQDVDECLVVRPRELAASTQALATTEAEMLVLTEAHSANDEAVAETPISPNAVNTGNDFTTIREKLASDSRCVLLFDQYEELFALPNQVEVQQRVKTLFDQAVRSEQPVIFTLRSDFEWQVKASDLSDYWQKEFIFRVPPMNLDQLREAVTGPAWWAMYDFRDHSEPDDNDTGEVLINEILEDVANAPGALPLLSFTMHQFYERARTRNRTLTLEDYRTLQGVEGAISRKANEVYGEPGEQQRWAMSDRQRLFRQVLIRMVNIYDGAFTRRRVYYAASERATDHLGHPILNELDFPDQDALLDQIVQELVAAQLVVTGIDEFGASYVEPAHAALINHWDRCRQWLDQFGKDTLSLQRRLWQTVLDEAKENGAAPTPVLVNRAEERQNDDPKDLATTIAHTWEFNPKLEEVTKSILDPQERWIDRFSGELLEEMALLLWGEALRPETISRLENLQRPQEQDHTLVRRILGLDTADAAATISGAGLDAETPVDSLTVVQAIQLQMDNWLNAREKAFIKTSWQRRIGRIQQLTKERNEARANELAAKATASFNRKAAFRMAELAQAIDPGNLKVKEQLIRYYHLSAEPPHYSLDEHGANIGGLAFSPDGTILASSGADHTIRLWNALTGAALARLDDHRRYVSAVYFWPGSNTRLISSSHDGTIKIWGSSGDTWQLELSIGEVQDNLESLAVSPDGRYIATGNWEGQLVLWATDRLTTGENQSPLFQLQFGTDERHRKITTLNFSPDSRKLVAGNRYGEVKVWHLTNDTLSGELSFEGHQHPEEIYNAVFLDNDHVLSGAWDRKLWRWRIAGTTTEDHHLISSENERTGFSIRYSAVSPNLRYLAHSVDRVYLYEFDHATKTRGKLLHELRLDAGRPSKMVFSNDGALLAAAVGSSIKVWNLQYENPDAPLAPHYQEYIDRRVPFMSGNRELKMACASDGSFKIEALPHQRDIVLTDYKDKTTRTYNSDGAIVRFLTFFSDNTHFLAGDAAGIIKIWDRTTAEQTPIYKINTGFAEITHVAVSKDGRTLIGSSWGGDARIMVWNSDDNGFPEIPSQVFEDYWDGCFSVNFSPDEQHVVIAQGREGTKVFAFSPQRKILPGHIFTISGDIGYAHYSEDGKFIFTYSHAEQPGVWDAETGTLRMSLPELRNTKWGKQLEDAKKWLIAASAGPPSRAVWYDSDALLAAANQDPWMGTLTPHEITIYQLEPYLQMAGYLDAEGSPAPIIQRGQEGVIFNFARYFLEKAKQSAKEHQRVDYLDKAGVLFTAGKAIRKLHRETTYGRYLQEINRLRR